MYLSIILCVFYLQTITALYGLQNEQKKLVLTLLLESYLEDIEIEPEYKIEVSVTKCTVTLYQENPSTPAVPLQNALILLHHLSLTCEIKEMTLSWYGKREVQLIRNLTDPLTNTQQIIDSSLELKEGKIIKRDSDSSSISDARGAISSIIKQLHVALPLYTSTVITSIESNELLIDVHPNTDSTYLIHAGTAVFAQALHISLQGKYRVQITLPEFAIAVETKRSEDGNDEVFMSDIPIDGLAQNIQIRRKEDTWKSMVRTSSGLDLARVQFLSPQECKVTIPKGHECTLDLPVLWIMLHTVHTSLNMRDTVLDFFGERRLRLRTEKYWNMENKQSNDRLIVISEPYEQKDFVTGAVSASDHGNISLDRERLHDLLRVTMPEPPIDRIALNDLSDSDYESLKKKIQDVADEIHSIIDLYTCYELVDNMETRNANMFSVETKRSPLTDGIYMPLWRSAMYVLVVTAIQILHAAVNRAYKVQITVPGCYTLAIQRSSEDPRYDEIVEVE